MTGSAVRDRSVQGVLALGGFLATSFLPSSSALAAEGAVDPGARADVVVLVDTSVSMLQPGMDPERTSLLVTKLLADIVPGDLAVVRLLDLVADAALLPNRETGISEPCQEDPTKSCTLVEPATDWAADARRERHGALLRPALADPAFKQQLDRHLEPRANNSLVGLALRAAQGVFDAHAEQGNASRTVIWLSDGHASDPESVREAIRELVSAGVAVEAILLGAGRGDLARSLGLEPRHAASPAELMRAFAAAFRRIVSAPYEIDHAVAHEPTFAIAAGVDQAWIVVYGDDSLSAAWLDGPSGRIPVATAAERWPGAGAYRVAYLDSPMAGRYAVSTDGGGDHAAYAVVQRSSFVPVLVAPKDATAGAPVLIVTAVRMGTSDQLLRDPDLLVDLRLTVTVDGRKVALRDDGSAGDPHAGDGHFTALVAFEQTGDAALTLHLVSPLLERQTSAVVAVSGRFRSRGRTARADLGSTRAGETACAVLALHAEHVGAVPLRLEAARSLPDGHILSVRGPEGDLTVGGPAMTLEASDSLSVCLRTAVAARASAGGGEPWLALRLAGSESPEHAVSIALDWQLNPLTFWQRWGRLISILLLVCGGLFVAGGWVWPRRFQRALAITFVPDADELDIQSPQPVVQWHGVGIGFYRHARAYLHPDLRLSGKASGALASLHAEGRAPCIRPGRGAVIHRQSADGDWDAVDAGGRTVRPGDILRISDRGPFIRVGTRGAH